jgi:hypothetical protein
MNIAFDKSFASHEKSKYWSDKNELTPEMVFKSSGKRFIFNCETCKHEFITTLSAICRNRWCPYCSNTTLCRSNDCIICFNKSFASIDRHIYLKDKAINPRTIAKYSNKLYDFVCNICSHEIHQSINSVSSNIWCKYCENQQLCDDLDCIICFSKSFANSDKIHLWSLNNEIDPRFVCNFSHTKYLFSCKECNHDFECSPANINYDRTCSYCASRKLCNDTKCTFCFNKSFASYIYASCWSDKNIITPRDVFRPMNIKNGQ